MIWYMAHCKFRHNDIYGTDVTGIDVERLYDNLYDKLNVKTTPRVLLILKGRLLCMAYSAIFGRQGVVTAVCHDPLVAYEKYLSTSQRLKCDFDLVIADWALASKGGTSSQDIVQYVRDGGNKDTVFVALCGRGVLAGDAIRNGADLFLRKPLVLHLETVRRLLLPRAMSHQGFPVSLLRRPANHQKMRRVFGAEPTYADELESSAPRSDAFLHSASMGTAAVQRLITEVVDEMENAEHDIGTEQEVFVADMITYVRQQQPQYSSERWHRYLVSSMQALQSSKAVMKRLVDETSVNRREIEHCWAHHRRELSAGSAASSATPTRVTRRELMMDILRLQQRNEELQQLALQREADLRSLQAADTSVATAVQDIYRFYQEQRERQRAAEQAQRQQRMAAKKPVLQHATRPSSGTKAMSSKAAMTAVVAAAAISGEPLSVSSSAATTPTASQRRVDSGNLMVPRVPAQPSTSARAYQHLRVGSASRGEDSGVCRSSHRALGVCALLEQRLMSAEDDPAMVVPNATPQLHRRGTKAAAEAPCAEVGEPMVSFHLAWPPHLRITPVPSVYQSMFQLFERILDECTKMSKQVLGVAPVCLSRLEGFESRLHDVLGSDPTPWFDVPAAVFSGATQHGSEGVKKKPNVSSPTASTLKKQPTFAGPEAHNDADPHHDSPSTGSPKGKPFPGYLPASASRSLAEAQAAYHALLLRQSALLLERVQRHRLLQYYHAWFGYSRGAAVARRTRNGSGDNALVHSASGSGVAKRTSVTNASSPSPLAKSHSSKQAKSTSSVGSKLRKTSVVAIATGMGGGSTSQQDPAADDARTPGKVPTAESDVFASISTPSRGDSLTPQPSAPLSPQTALRSATDLQMPQVAQLRT